MRIDRDGIRFCVPLVLLSVAGFWIHPVVAAVLLVLTAFVLWFFRDPERQPPADPDAVLSPADGRILGVSERRISVFMNVFNVHVCRAPVAGTVRSIRHTPGRFGAAFRDDAPERNERAEIDIETATGAVRFALVAGLVARRIVCRVAAGERLAAGQRVGLIRFGSRVDVELPQGAEPLVRRGQRVVAGRTVLARRRAPAGRSGTFPI